MQYQSGGPTGPGEALGTPQNNSHVRRRWAFGAAVAWSVGLAGAAAAQTAWQPWTLDFTGPTAQELGGAINPFLDRRLDVTFTGPSGQTYVVPGYFAADGNAAVTHAESGDVWRAKFTPDEAGAWTYAVSFRQGAGVAVADNALAGTADATLDGMTGAFTAAAFDPSADGFLGKGRLAYTGGHYLQTLGDEKYWIKTGVDSPENPLGYLGFDNTTSQNGRGPNYNSDFGGNAYGRLHQFPTHRADWNPGDPDWQRDPSDPVPGSSGDRDGRNLIGALNYLSSVGANSLYFLPMNLGGDGQDSYPFTDPSDNNTDATDERYDVSKLEQWELAFDHAQRKGIHLHVVLNEAEVPNKNYLDGATLGDERKLFYREMVARFGHHNALQWNISEEYNLTNGFGDNEQAQADTAIEFAEYLSELDPYDHPVTVHNIGNVSIAPTSGPWQYFIGEEDFDLTSLQGANKVEGWGDVVENYRAATAASGRPIPVMIDEPGSFDRDADNGTTLSLPTAVRVRMTYDILFSGGGVEWFAETLDQSLENFRGEQGTDFDQMWRETAYARELLERTPFWLMEPNDDLVRGEDQDFGGAEVLALEGSVYAIYLPDGSNDDGVGGIPPELDLRGTEEAAYTLRWFNPRTGEFEGETRVLAGGDWVSLGLTPDGFQNTNDWVALVESFAAVPEPGTLGLAGAGLAGILWRRRTK
ncbi:MAG: DUF5060 domain-containing protein [Planctomycetota bacterium]